ncbi:hypothetical protein O9992_09515 [Vibrio lentus]|nr:hypothetical protein [Vibrio lentus]
MSPTSDFKSLLIIKELVFSEMIEFREEAVNGRKLSPVFHEMFFLPALPDPEACIQTYRLVKSLIVLPAKHELSLGSNVSCFQICA